MSGEERKRFWRGSWIWLTFKILLTNAEWFLKRGWRVSYDYSLSRQCTAFIPDIISDPMRFCRQKSSLIKRLDFLNFWGEKEEKSGSQVTKLLWIFIIVNVINYLGVAASESWDSLSIMGGSGSPRPLGTIYMYFAELRCVALYKPCINRLTTNKHLHSG